MPVFADTSNSALRTVMTIAVACAAHTSATADALHAGSAAMLASNATFQARVAQGVTPSGEQAMEGTFEVTHISVSINRAAKDVYSFISDGTNLEQWASGLGTTFRRDGDDWQVQGPLGSARVRLARPNEFGVADQTVILESGVTAHNPIRVVPNGTGSTVTFTLMRLPGVSAEKFKDDARWVKKDLDTLKAVLERPQR